ncbi:GNAT family N-acetyltransferase [Phaeodactylibacter luteus]|uniref:GNAT family N-acetyltransferase n=2 Tax=Phaeodactylibacter luteus TaxID=1564516 RepID=A0A5C6RNQ7_9BACT|nr:GNAT family N-acetyltransferase [Phaeodactylibacter luteus]
MEKNRLARFLIAHEPNSSRESILEALDYAVKGKPSFGGFITVAIDGSDILGAVVANCTGMEAYNPKYLFVFVTLGRAEGHADGLLQNLLERALQHADGDIAMHVKPGHPALSIFQQMGFEAEYLELRHAHNSPNLSKNAG